MIVFVLLAAAVVCAVAAWLTGISLLAYMAAGASLLCCLALAAAWWLGRRNGRSAAEAEGDIADDGPTDADSTGAGDADDGDGGEGPLLEVDTPTGADSEADVGSPEVWVIPGRRRFHRRACRLTDGHEREALTEVEAREEGFTPCSVCGSLPAAVGGQRAG